MKKRRQLKGKSKLATQKNKVRGVISAGRRSSYNPEIENRAAKFQHQLRDVLVEAREKLGGVEAKDFMRWVEAQTSMQVPGLKAAPTDSELSSLVTGRVPRGFAEEMAWVARRLSEESSLINSFRQEADRLENAALGNLRSELEAILHTIEKKYGRSIWWIESKIAIAQSIGGLDAQKLATSAIRKANPNSLAGYIARFASVRNEPTTTLNSFFTDASDRIGRIRGQGTLRAYLRFKLLWNASFSSRELSGVLLIAQSLSTVDLYETFVEVLQYSASNGPSSAVRRCIADSITILEKVCDVRLDKLAIVLGLERNVNLKDRSYDASDLILGGNSRLGVRVALKQCLKSPTDFKLPLYVASVLNSESIHADRSGHSVWRSIIRLTSSLLQFGENFSSNWLDLQKQLRNWTFSPALRAYYYTLESHVTHDPELRRKSRIMATLNSSFLDIEELGCYGEEFAAALAARLSLQLLHSPTINFFVCLRDCSGALPACESYEIFMHAQIASDRDDTDLLEALERRAATTGIRRVVVQARRYRIGSLATPSSLRALLRATINAYFELEIGANLLPLRPGLHGLRWRQMKPFAGGLDLPIALHICWRETGNEHIASNLRFAYDAVLESCEISNISDLPETTDGWSVGEAIYFLQYVCVPEVIDMSVHIKSSREANEVRRNICTKLIQIDPANKLVYEQETLVITHKLSLEDGLRVLDSSRIHVDTGAITSWALREWAPNIIRYKALVDAGMGVSDSFDDVWRELNSPHGSSKKLLEIPDSDADLILVELITGLRSKFLLDPSHGLDSYLSRRVRHHSMSGYLRGTLENEQLITTKDERSRRYSDNGFWKDQISSLTPEEDAQLQYALGKFSEEFDREIYNLKTNVLRVRSSDYPKGLFWIPVSPAMFHLVRSAVQSDISIEGLCNVCYPIFWASLRPGLQEARSQLKTSTYNAFSSSLHRLKASLRKTFKDAGRYSHLSVAIQKASEDLNRKITSVADWFNRTESTTSDKAYSLSQALDIGLEAARHSYKPFAPKLVSKVNNAGTVSALTLVQISDLLLAMLGNVRQHAACGKEPEVLVFADMSDEFGICLKMISEVGPEAGTSEARARVDRIRGEIADGSYLDKVQAEGNSGLIKMACVALSRPNGRIEFGFSDDQRFSVLVEFEAPRVLELISGNN